MTSAPRTLTPLIRSPRILTLLAAATLTLGLSACTGAPAAVESTAATTTTTITATGACDGDQGVTIVVDASALDKTAPRESCFFATDKVKVADALTALGIETEGTKQYGDQVVCRVDGLPSASEPVGSAQDPAYVEACDKMPAAFAYWALWVKPAGGAWDYAQEGLATLTAAPGDSVELLFSLDGAPAAPAA